MAKNKKLFTSGYLSAKECRHGIFVYNRLDQYVGRSLDTYGEFSNQEFEIMKDFASGLVLDVGANIGALTVPLARVAKHVIAIEPQPWVADVLTANIAINCLRNVDVIRGALSDTNCLVQMPNVPPDKTGNFGGIGLHGAPADAKIEGSINVPAYAFDGFWEEQKAPDNCTLIKMDVEGHELPALKGMEKFLKRERPVLYVENDRKEKSADLMKYISGLDYDLFWHTPKLYERRNYFDSTDNVFGNIVSINLFCVPKERPVTADFARRFNLQVC